MGGASVFLASPAVLDISGPVLSCRLLTGNWRMRPRMT
jgi:hypothetical protein